MTSAATPLLRATIIAFTFFILELIAGWMSGSLAIVSDALSLFQSSVGFAVGWAAIHMAEWGPTRRHTFGFARVELLGSMITVILNWLLAIGLLLQASTSLQYPTLSNPHIMLPISLISLFRNLTTLLLLVPPSPMPAAEQTPLLQLQRGIQPPNLNLKTAFISSLSDTICSALLLLASCLLLQHPDSTKIDPAFTIAIAIVNIVSSFPLLNQYLSIILEGVPSHLCAEEIRSDLLETFPFINAIHSINIWSLTPGREICILNISLGPSSSLPRRVISAKLVEAESDSSCSGNESETDVGECSCEGRDSIKLHSATKQSITEYLRRVYAIERTVLDIS